MDNVTTSMNVSWTSYDQGLDELVHPHWTKFYETGHLPAPHWAHLATAIYIGTIGCIGFIGNALLFWTFSRNQSLLSPSNMLVANLALADLALCVGAFPLMTISSSAERWLFGEAGCTFYATWAGLTSMASVGTMAGIAMDRFFSITRWSKWHLTYKRVYVMIAIIWLYAFAVVAPPLVGWSHYIFESMQTSCTFDYLSRSAADVSFFVYLFGAGYALPLGIIIVCYFLIIKHMSHHKHLLELANVKNWSGGSRKTRRSTASSSDSDASASRPTALPPRLNMRAVFTCILIVIFFCMAWTPYAVCSLIGVFGDQSLLTPIATSLTVIFAKTNVIYNPIIYAFMNGKFRRALVETFTGTRRDQRRMTLSLSNDPNACLMIEAYRPVYRRGAGSLAPAYVSKIKFPTLSGGNTTPGTTPLMEASPNVW